MRRHIIIYISAVMTLLTGLSACSEAVELCEEKNYPHSHFSDLRVTFDWTGFNSYNKPDSMLVFAEKLVGRENCGFVVDLKTNKGEYLYNAFEDTVPVIEEGGKSYSNMKVYPGKYAVMSFNHSRREFDYHCVDDYFLDHSDSAELENIFIQYRAYNQYDPNLKKYVDTWTDFNPYSKYVQSDVSPFVYAVSDVINCESAGSQPVVFRPKSFMQLITFSFTIQKQMDAETKFMVDSVHLEVSGVPSRFYLMNGGIDVRKTYKILAKPLYTSEIDNYNNKKLKCEVYFNAPGIVPPMNSKTKLGPGIAVIKVFLHAESAPSKAHAINVYVNLYNTIKKSPMIKMNEEQTYGVLRSQYHTINVDTPLKIDSKSIIEAENNPDNNHDRWNACDTSIDVDI